MCTENHSECPKWGPHSSRRIRIPRRFQCKNIRIDFFLARRPHCNALPSPLSRAEKVADRSWGIFFPHLLQEHLLVVQTFPRLGLANPNALKGILTPQFLMHAPCSPSPIRSHELNLYRRSTHKGVLWSNPRHYFQYCLWLMNKPSLVGALELISEWSTFLWHQKLYVTGVVWSLFLTHVDIKLICMLFLLTRSSTHHHLKTSYHIENSSFQHF